MSLRYDPLMRDHEYIGDGVYACHDGYHIWLSTLDDFKIALEPIVFGRLLEYEQKIRAQQESKAE